MSIIAYERVSTKEQGGSGLGLEGQRAAIEAFAKRRSETVVKFYTEVESGKRSDNRPELLKALAHAKRSKATLVVSKIDRLSRNVKFLATVFESGVAFAAVDMPEANRLTLHVMAAIAEHEARAISERTKSALAALKARGALLGSSRPGHWNGREHLRRAGALKASRAAAQAARKNCEQAYQDVLPLMRELRAGGESYQAIARRLNDDGQTSRRGKKWSAMLVWRVLKKEADHVPQSV